MSDTPRTDAVTQAVDMYVGPTLKDAKAAIDLARQLERELTAANARIKELEQYEGRYYALVRQIQMCGLSGVIFPASTAGEVKAIDKAREV